MVLWALMDSLAPSLGHTCSIGHIDHGLQPGADAAQVIQERAAATGQAVHITTLALAPGADLQARARVARYEALHQMARTNAADAILTAHHADDQAETVLMRACRGTGLGGLSAIRWNRADGVLRPLLDTSRADLHAAATSLRVSWWEDPTNATDTYHRNQMRHTAIPALEAVSPGAAKGLARTAANVAGSGEAMEHWVDVALAPLVVRSADTLLLPRHIVPSDTALISPLLSWICREFAMNPPSQAAVRQLVQTLRVDRDSSSRDRSSISISTSCDLHGLHVQIDANNVTFCRTK